jgi:Taurine catabolism dioxygenase TauD, TfdA family
MLPPLPETARTQISSTLARELIEAAESLPLYENEEFYSPALQGFVHNSVREACPDGFDFVVSLIAERIARRPYCALLQGLRFDEGNRLFVAINRAFGELVGLPFKKPRAQLVHYIQPSTDIPAARGEGREVENLHTDAVDQATPIQFVSMICVRPDQGGDGRSRLLDVDTVRDEVKAHLGTDILELLTTEPVPWQMHEGCGGGVKWQRVLTESGMCWRRYTINRALTENGAKLSERMLTSLDGFGRVIAACPRTMDFLMREGELLFSDNTRTIHARTRIADEAATHRLMIRSWINAS